jgi:hypothetical protein
MRPAPRENETIYKFVYARYELKETDAQPYIDRKKLTNRAHLSKALPYCQLPP